MVKNQPANAGDTGLLWDPEIPQAKGQLNSQATTLKPVLQSREATAEAHMPRAHAAQPEKPQQWAARTLQLRESPCGNRDSAPLKTKK